jgi:hypothetical protein
MRFLYIFLLISLFSQGQSKKDNAIKIPGVTFKQAASALLDYGYIIEKSDSSLGTIKTEYKTGKGENKWMKLCLFVRIKDSFAIVTGKWYNTLTVNLVDRFSTVENESAAIEYTWGNPKRLFGEMKEFALSFGRPVEYLKN